jgi:XTP/dITP diphosphohydrolase
MSGPTAQFTGPTVGNRRHGLRCGGGAGAYDDFVPPCHQTLVFATHNPQKAREVRAILGGEFIVRDLGDFPELGAPVEDGGTFEANAVIKALAASRSLGPDWWVLADDSGLEVDALDGAPGVHSSRFAGVDANDAANRAKLLAELARVRARGPRRRARFRCVLALARGGRVAATFDGVVDGMIADGERGSGGFGYDPIFVPDGFIETFAELGSNTKNRLSHRGRALGKFRAFFTNIAET